MVVLLQTDKIVKEDGIVIYNSVSIVVIIVSAMRVLIVSNILWDLIGMLYVIVSTVARHVLVLI